jgi:hypothetical protein
MNKHSRIGYDQNDEELMLCIIVQTYRQLPDWTPRCQEADEMTQIGQFSSKRNPAENEAAKTDAAGLS